MDPDQARPSVGPDLDPNGLFLKKIFEKTNFEKSADDNRSMKNYPACADYHRNYTCFRCIYICWVQGKQLAAVFKYLLKPKTVNSFLARGQLARGQR